MSSAIRDVGETLLELLRSNLNLQPDEIALLSPAEAQQHGVRLTLFLYSIAPVAELRNDMEIPGMPGQGDVISQPLDLYYLLTSFTPAQGQSLSDRALDSHLVLGNAMRVFFQNGTLSGSILRGSLPRDEELRLSLQPITVEDLTRIWEVFPENVLQASASYLVTPVRLRAATPTATAQRVVSRQTDVDHLVPTQPSGVSP